ncbi:MAG: hypothetical protein AAGA11_02995 [Pseudomonadota bacterium]
MTAGLPLGIGVLGATGVIGASAFDVVARHPSRFRVRGLAGGHSVEAMRALWLRLGRWVVSMADPSAARAPETALAGEVSGVEVLSGNAGVNVVAVFGDADTVLSAITGAAGLGPTLSPARAGTRILLVHKEALAQLRFEQPDSTASPALRLAREAMRTGGTATAVLNVANDMAVSADLAREIGFRTISEVVDHTLQRSEVKAARCIDTVLDAYRQAREFAAAHIAHPTVEAT